MTPFALFRQSRRASQLDLVGHADCARSPNATVPTDRMGALGRSQGRRFVLHPPTVGFATHHSIKIASCQAGDAKRKGKVERPFRQLQETFLAEVEADGIPLTIDELNLRGPYARAPKVGHP